MIGLCTNSNFWRYADLATERVVENGIRQFIVAVKNEIRQVISEYGPS